MSLADHILVSVVALDRKVEESVPDFRDIVSLGGY